jgi:hypothetical protein
MNPPERQEQLTQLNSKFQALIDEVARLTKLRDEAKTSLKKEYYKKKIEKIRSKVFKNLLDKSVLDPSLIKREKAIEDEQVQ